MSYPKQLFTKRLCIRPYSMDDAPMYFRAALQNERHLAKFERFNALVNIQTLQDSRDTIQNFMNQWSEGKSYFLGLFNLDTGNWVGQIVFGPSNPKIPEYSIGYIADAFHEGKGYITEAMRAVLKVLFEDMGAHRIKSDCHENNQRSWRLLERCGFTREGHLRENKKNQDGSFHGDLLYGLLKGEYIDVIT